jgi:hypothetical protein
MNSSVPPCCISHGAYECCFFPSLDEVHLPLPSLLFLKISSYNLFFPLSPSLSDHGFTLTHGAESSIRNALYYTDQLWDPFHSVLAPREGFPSPEV